MNMPYGNFDTLARSRLLWGILTSAIFFAAVAVLAAFHFEETKELLRLLKNSDIGWIVIAIISQIPTYIFTGLVWHLSARAVNYPLSLKSLTELALEQLSVSQIIPSAGLAGNIVVIRAMKRFGLSNTLALEIFFIETLSYYIAFSGVALLAVIILWLHQGVTPIISSLVSIFFVIQFAIGALIWSAANHKKLKVLVWIKEKKIFSKLFSLLENVSGERVFSRSLLFETSFFRLGVFFLDTITFFAILRSIGVEASLTTSFVAFIIASIAGAVTLLPGGLGGFEAAAVGILNLLGVPLGAAIAATAIFRILTLWLPLVPGLIYAREDLGFKQPT